jgi:phage tail sheath protein FI
MAGAYKTPGVYIVEKNAFPNSVVEVATAVPAFVGYTRIADNKGSSLLDKPWRISSFKEFIDNFGGAPDDKFDVVKKDPDDKTAAPGDFKIGSAEYYLHRPNQKADSFRFYLYHCMQLFFQNGGGACYIVSVGLFDAGGPDKTALQNGIDLLLKEQEPTMVVLPDAMALDRADCIALQQHSLEHCGLRMKSRFAILDVYDGHLDLTGDNPVKAFRNDLGINYLDFAAAYYPWLNSSIVQTTDLGFDNFVNLADLQKVLTDEAGTPVRADLDPILKQVGAAKTPTSLSDDELHKILFAVSPGYANMLMAIKRKLNLLPPAAAMAGVYTMVDNTRGVWKAPANVSLASVIAPAVNITHDEQEDLNVTIAGKSINAIRTFIGEGTLVWGARTLDGNSLDWRYINVRRTMIMIEESLRLATKAYVFEPNVSATWVTVKGMADNFLTGIWKRGGLAGATAADAFSVSVGLGETMTPEDILEGILRVTILLALSRPAEFIEITFQQQMQKS